MGMTCGCLGAVTDLGPGQLQVLKNDWLKVYGYKPVLMETFVGKDRFAGTCYKAANWAFAGSTQGRGKLDRFNEYKLPVTCLSADRKTSIYILSIRTSVCFWFNLSSFARRLFPGDAFFVIVIGAAFHLKFPGLEMLR